MAEFFVYGEAELAHLKARDAALAAVIDRIGPIERAVTPDLFTALIHAIVGQQISTKAQATVWARLEALCAPVSPERLAALSVDDLQRCGLSFRKTEYMKGIAVAVLDGSLDLPALAQASDEAVCQRLSQLKGIGVWTAEMLMTFSMQRPNVISYGDLAILRGLRMLYRHRVITPKLFAKYRRRYAPYATVASLYLWAVAGGACPELSDPAVKK
jgi:3-methyladenine DNA glycosylase/8-oxoguanine DNA glycosylase